MHLQIFFFDKFRVDGSFVKQKVPFGINLKMHLYDYFGVILEINLPPFFFINMR